MGNRFIKRGVFWIITHIVVTLLIIFIQFSALIQAQEGLLLFIIFFFAAYMMVVLLAPMSIIVKTAGRIKGYTDFLVDYSVYDSGCYLMIDTKHGKIACVFATNPFKIQIIDASNITEVKTFAGNSTPAKRKTTNRLGVHFWVGRQKCTIHTYRAGRSYIVIRSEEGQKKVREAGNIYAKLLMAKDVAQRHKAFKNSELTLDDMFTRDQISQINTAVVNGDKVAAVKIIQFATQIGIAQSKEIVDNWNFYYKGGFYRSPIKSRTKC